MKPWSRDLVYYTAIGVAVIVAALGVAFFAPGLNSIDSKWVVLIFATALLFGYPIRWYWRFRRSTKFWVLHSGFIFLHLFAWVYLLRRMGHFPLLWCVPCLAVEIAGLLLLLSTSLQSPPDLGTR